VVATLALFVALGGSSYAAVQISSRQIRDSSVRGVDLRKGSVGTRELRDGALGSSDLRNGSVGTREVLDGALGSGDIRDRELTGEDVRGGALTGAQMAPDSLGTREVQNLLSSDFAPGQLPDPVPVTLPPGKTLKGMFTASVTGSEDDNGISRSPISFPIPLAAAPAGEAYHVVGAAPTTECPGTPADPEAAPGMLCVYEAGLTGRVTLRGFFEPVTGENFRSSRFGAIAFVNGYAGSGIRGTWAVTAP
jgi:hypothetical protein